ncbi:MAG: DUF2142 domain-containing protein [Ardenticatenaceae bacterium]|nr:DUF2142 domain-containing protein [Ardenticatenaceae bacterium]MCB9443238.1 DUF2142 domain-containing protein [Ardenticatenaceae bacterium]
MKNRHSRLLLILLLYLAIALAYSIVTPLFEAPDEHWHYFTAQYIADTGHLPVIPLDDSYDEWLSQEAAQPPLYYLLGSLLITPIDTADAREQIQLNLFAWIGNATALANVNRFIHTPYEAWPWQGLVLATHLLRGLSVLLGLGTLLCIYGSGRFFWPEQENRALLATALVAFLPQFDFIHGAISNDTLITFLSSLVIWQLLRLWFTVVTPPRLLLLGITLGLAALTKNAGVLLLVYALGVLVLLAIRDWKPEPKNRLQSLIIHLFLVIAPVLLIAGWLWWRNRQLYGDWTATNQFIRFAGGDREFSLWQVLAESDGLWLSLIAIFGWFNLRAPDWIYWVWSGMAVLALLGAVTKAKLARREISLQSLVSSLQKPWMPGFLLAGWVLAVYGGLVTFMMQTEAAQGRLLFPAIVPLALGLAYGLSRLPVPGERLAWLWPGLGLATTLYALFFVIRPAYASPEPVTAVPPSAQFGPVAFQAEDGIIQLVGVEMEPGQSTEPSGNPIKLVLYWQSITPVSQDYVSSVHLLGRELESVGSVNRFPAGGMIPTSRWQPGQIWRDEYHVYVGKNAIAPSQLLVSVSLYDDEAERPLPATWPDGTAVNPLLVGEPARLAAGQTHPTMPQTETNIPFAEGITLAGYDLVPGDPESLTLYWQANETPTQDYTVFVQLLNENGEWLAGADAPPVNNFYPTLLWQEGDWIDDLHRLVLPPDLPPGIYTIQVGLYDPVNGARLARQDGGGDAVDIPLEVSR